MQQNQSNETNNQIETFNQPTANENSEFAPPTANPSPAMNAATDQPTIAEDGNAPAIVPVLYDAAAHQRFPFSVKEDGVLVETAHVFKPLDDERHLAYISEFVKIRDGERVDKTLTELSVDLWRELIESIENLEVEPGADFRDIPDAEEEISPLLISYLTVIVKPPTVSDKRQRSPIKSDRQTIITQAYFNGEVCEQKHILQAKSDEWRKKYNRVQRSQYVEDKTKGKTNEPKLTFVPQNRAKAALYDEMLIEARGFADDVIPMRFKVVAVDAAFESSVVDAKK